MLPDPTSAFSVPPSPSLLRINPKKLLFAPCLTLVSHGSACSCFRTSAEPPWTQGHDAQPWCISCPGDSVAIEEEKANCPKRAASPNSGPGNRTQGLGGMTASKQCEKGCP